MPVYYDKPLQPSPGVERPSLEAACALGPCHCAIYKRQLVARSDSTGDDCDLQQDAVREVNLVIFN